MVSRRVGLLLLAPGSDRKLDLIAAFLRLISAAKDAPEPPTGEPPRPPTGSGHVETRVENGRIWTPAGLAPRSVSEAIMNHWPRDVWSDAAHVSYYESSWEPAAERNTLDRAGGVCNVPIGRLPDGTPIVSEQSIGLFQINRCAHGGTPSHWRDADNNAKYGAQLYASQGWSPWFVTARDLGLLRR